eukprot:SAG22_NODE_352_length_11827_cov_3.941252_4_plen_195_part_00
MLAGWTTFWRPSRLAELTDEMHSCVDINFSECCATAVPDPALRDARGCPLSTELGTRISLVLCIGWSIPAYIHHGVAEVLRQEHPLEPSQQRACSAHRDILLCVRLRPAAGCPLAPTAAPTGKRAVDREQRIDPRSRLVVAPLMAPLMAPLLATAGTAGTAAGTSPGVVSPEQPIGLRGRAGAAAAGRPRRVRH